MSNQVSEINIRIKKADVKEHPGLIRSIFIRFELLFAKLMACQGANPDFSNKLGL